MADGMSKVSECRRVLMDVGLGRIRKMVFLANCVGGAPKEKVQIWSFIPNQSLDFSGMTVHSADYVIRIPIRSNRI